MDATVEPAVPRFPDEHRRGQERLDALRRICDAVDSVGLYDRILLPPAASGDGEPSGPRPTSTKSAGIT